MSKITEILDEKEVGGCPMCGNGDITYANMEWHDENRIIIPAKCNDPQCGFCFGEIYWADCFEGRIKVGENDYIWNDEHPRKGVIDEKI